MDFITWSILLMPIPICIIAGFIARKLLLRYLPSRLENILSEFLRSAAAPQLIEKMAANTGIEALRPLIEKHLDHFLGVKLGQEMPVVGMFVGEKTIAQMKQLFMQELELLFPEVMGQYIGSFAQNLGSPATTRSITQGFQSKVLPLLSREAGTITLYASLCGVIISLVQFILFSVGH